MLSKLLLGAGLLLSPTICLAQAAPSLYVGASASMWSTSPFRSYNSNLVGPAVTIGYQFNPRWAIQTGADLVWQNDESTSPNYTGGSIYDLISYEEHFRRFVIPLLARYTFTDPANPLHIDALFGGNWAHGTSRGNSSYLNKAGIIEVYSYSYKSNTINLGLGPSVRYTLASHLDLTASSLLQAEITSFDGVHLTTQLGIQYRFGQ